LEIVFVGLKEILVVLHVALVESQILSELLAIIRRSSEGRVKLLVDLLGHHLADQCWRDEGLICNPECKV